MLGGCESFHQSSPAQPGVRHQRGRRGVEFGARGRASECGSHPALPALFDDIERRTFDFFWANGNPANGMVPDRYPSASPASIAAIGMALTAYVIGVDRGFITREQARARTLATVRFFRNAPQGAAARRRDRVQGVLLPFPRHEDRPARRPQRAVHRRHRRC